MKSILIPESCIVHISRVTEVPIVWIGEIVRIFLVGRFIGLGMHNSCRIADWMGTFAGISWTDCVLVVQDRPISGGYG